MKKLVKLTVGKFKPTSKEGFRVTHNEGEVSGIRGKTRNRKEEVYNIKLQRNRCVPVSISLTRSGATALHALLVTLMSRQPINPVIKKAPTV